MSLYICDPKKHPECEDKSICQTFCFITTFPEYSTDGKELSEEDIQREGKRRERKKRPAIIRTDGLAPDMEAFEPLLIEPRERKETET